MTENDKKSGIINEVKTAPKRRGRPPKAETLAKRAALAAEEEKKKAAGGNSQADMQTGSKPGSSKAAGSARKTGTAQKLESVQNTESAQNSENSQKSEKAKKTESAQRVKSSPEQASKTPKRRGRPSKAETLAKRAALAAEEEQKPEENIFREDSRLAAKEISEEREPLKTPYWEYDDTVSDTDDFCRYSFWRGGRRRQVCGIRRYICGSAGGFLNRMIPKEQCLLRNIYRRAMKGNRILQNLGTQRSLRKTMSGRLTGQVKQNRTVRGNTSDITQIPVLPIIKDGMRDRVLK